MQLDLIGRDFGAVRVLGPLRLTAARGDRIAILGPSGVGKSTLLRVMLGLDTGFRGRLSGSERLAPVFQEPLLLPWRTASQNLTIAAGVDEAGAARWLDRVGLSGLGGRWPRQMSLGQQRRLSLARAFAARPDILAMDEPFASLDRETAARMLALTRAMLDETGAGLILVTHDPADARTLGARMLHLTGQPATLAEPA